jgi:hypothetical protein
MNQFTRFLKQAVRLSSIIGASSMLIVGIVSVKPAQAFDLFTEWQICLDSLEDSITGNIVGGTKYELYAFGLKQTADNILISMTGLFPFLDGVYGEYAHDNIVRSGDIVFNFTGKNLADANGELFTIRFDPFNESQVEGTGVFANATVFENSKANGILLSDLEHYNQWIARNGNTTLPGNDPYFDLNSHIPNLTLSGTKVGDIQYLTDAQIQQEGLNWSALGVQGLHTVNLSVSSKSLPFGDYRVHFGMECNNDAIACGGTLAASKKTPEPSALISLLGIGGFGLTKFRKRQQQTKNKDN